MPHFGISLYRLKEHFRKFWAIYIVGCTICALLSSILFTSTAPRTPIEQQVLIYLADDITNPDALEGVKADMLAYGQETDETLLEIVFEHLAYGDPQTDMYGSMILAARLSLREGDAFLASSFATEPLLMNEVYMPLDDYLADGWLADLDLEPVMHTSQETGETHVAALRLDNVPALAEMGAFNNNGAVLMIMWNSTNLETTMNVVEHMIRGLVEGTYASAENTQPAA